MRKAGEGVVVNVTSIAGTVGRGSSMPYCASKAALNLLTRMMARALAPAIRVNAVAPGVVKTRWVAQQAGRPDIIAWPGSCIVHEQFNARALAELRVKHPDAEVLSHPECDAAVLAQSDFIGSTKKIIDRAVASPARILIIGTEDGVFHQIRKSVPDKELIQIPGMDESCSCNRCPYMRLNTMEKLYLCLRDLEPEVTVPEDVRVRALRPLERMLELSKAS